MKTRKQKLIDAINSTVELKKLTEQKLKLLGQLETALKQELERGKI